MLSTAPLKFATSNGLHTVAKVLLEHEASITAEDCYKNTSLKHAIRTNSGLMTKSLYD